nr:MAG TPA: hypothetical protein [Caudoviricetes sp.]DAM58163.1 MAG TPA: hypothetical protein [Bacteriophage sp.]
MPYFTGKSHYFSCISKIIIYSNITYDHHFLLRYFNPY